MSGPKTAYRDTTRADCADLIQEGEPIYFTDGSKLCVACARRDQLICPECGGQKSAKYERCVGCSAKARKEGRFRVKIGTGEGS